MTDQVRIPPLPYEEWSDEARAVLPTHLRRPELYVPGAPGALPMPQAMGMLAHHLPIGDAWLAFNDVLAKANRVELRLRELVVLRVAWRTRSAYEWTQHTRIGHHAGVTVAQLHAIPDGAAAEIWTPLERALLRVADEIVDEQRVRDTTWSALAEHFDHEQLLEVVFVAGSYLCFAAVCNSAGLLPDPPTEPIDAPPLPGTPD